MVMRQEKDLTGRKFMLDEKDQVAQMAGVERKLTRDQKEQLK